MHDIQQALEAMRAKAKELKVQRDAELKGILTPEQFAKVVRDETEMNREIVRKYPDIK